MKTPTVSTVDIRVEAGLRCVIDLPGLRATVLEGPDAGAEVIKAGDVLRIGSSRENDLRLGDSTVSRNHAEIRWGQNGLTLTDLGSTNGSFVRDVEIQQAKLQDGDQFRLGNSVLRITTMVIERASQIKENSRLGQIVGTTPKMRELFAVLQSIAPINIQVLLQGESGTGKELIAQELHRLSRRSGPFLVFDAAVSDPESIRSDLFGHIEGAFTGAVHARKGAFRQAHCGTLFIDEIGELPLELQPRLLRALESRTVLPMGSDQPETVDVRVIAATHRDLKAMVKAGTFREDLYHRLAVVPITVPPLRDRIEDLDILTQDLSVHLKTPLRFSGSAKKHLKKYSWPGNIRELRNLLDRLAILVRHRLVEIQDLNLTEDEPLEAVALKAPSSASSESPEAILSVSAAEQKAILAALKKNNGNQRLAASELAISLATLKRRLKKYREEGVSL